MCVVCQIAVTGAAALAGLVPAAAVTDTASSQAAANQSVATGVDIEALSPVSLRVDDLDVKGCASPGQTVTATGSGFNVASNTPKVFITPGLFAYGAYPETSETISTDSSVKSSSTLSFVVPAASRFGRASIAGLDMTVLFRWPGYFADIAFLICGSGSSGNGGASGKTSPSEKASATTIARSSVSGNSLVGKQCAPVGTNLTVNGVKITCKRSAGSLRWTEAGK